MRNSLIALIDGDELCYRVGFASQHVWYKAYDLEDPSIEETEDLFSAKFKYKKQADGWINNDPTYWLCSSIESTTEEQAIATLRSAIRTIESDTNYRDYRIFLTGKDNFREKLATLLPYKGNRIESTKPIHFNLIKKALIETYYAEIVDGIEADDMLGITQCRDPLEDTIICSQDKDLNMIPGKHYNPNKRQLFEVTEEEAWKFHYYQILAGDLTDNIPGIYRVGLKTAKKMYRDCNSKEDFYKRAIEAYEVAIKDPVKNRILFNSGLTAEELVREIGSLLYIQQKPNDKWVI